MKGRPTLNIEADVHRRLPKRGLGEPWQETVALCHRACQLLFLAQRWSLLSWPLVESVEDIVQKVVYQTCAGKRKWNTAKGPLDMWLKDQVKSVIDSLTPSAPHRHETDSLDLARGDGSEDGADGSALELRASRIGTCCQYRGSRSAAGRNPERVRSIVRCHRR